MGSVRYRHSTTWSTDGGNVFNISTNSLIAVYDSVDSAAIGITDNTDFGYDAVAGMAAKDCKMASADLTATYSIQGVPWPVHRHTWRTRVVADVDCILKLEVTEAVFDTATDPEKLSIVIWDKELDIYWDWATEGPYEFNVTAGTDTYDRIYLFAILMPAHKKMLRPLEVTNLLFSTAQYDLIDEFDNAVVTKDYVDKRTPKNKYLSTTTAYDIIISDKNSTLIMDNAVANTITIPANSVVSFPVATTITLINMGAGVTTVGITTDTLSTNLGGLTIPQYEKRILTKVTSTQWVMTY